MPRTAPSGKPRTSTAMKVMPGVSCALVCQALPNLAPRSVRLARTVASTRRSGGRQAGSAGAGAAEVADRSERFPGRLVVVDAASLLCGSDELQPATNNAAATI